MVADWARNRRSGTHAISYIFESGDTHQKEANAIMDYAFRHEHVRMYRGHAFFPKEQTTPCQAMTSPGLGELVRLRRISTPPP